MKTLISLMTLASIATAGFAQECEQESNQEQKFVETQSGIVDMPSLNLQWSKCNVGETWAGQQCSGRATAMDYLTASSFAKSADLYSYDDWRLPTKEELMSLVDANCNLPSASLRFFPTMLNSQYWSSERYSFYAHVVSFDHGLTFSTQMSTLNVVRLVRTNR